jgi:hypothetical protein
MEYLGQSGAKGAWRTKENLCCGADFFTLLLKRTHQEWQKKQKKMSMAFSYSSI